MNKIDTSIFSASMVRKEVFQDIDGRRNHSATQDFDPLFTVVGSIWQEFEKKDGSIHSIESTGQMPIVLLGRRISVSPSLMFEAVFSSRVGRSDLLAIIGSQKRVYFLADRLAAIRLEQASGRKV
jgi:hypothetical protein